MYTITRFCAAKDIYLSKSCLSLQMFLLQLYSFIKLPRKSFLHENENSYYIINKP